MNYPLRLFIILFIGLNFAGCNKTSKPVSPPESSAEAHAHFEKAREYSDPREIISHLNKALNAVKDQKDTLLPLLLDYKIYYHSSLKEYDSAFYFSDSLINWAGGVQDTTNLSLGYYRKSRVHFHLKEHEEVFRNAFEARRISLLSGDSTSAGQRSLEMSLAQGRIGDHRGSQESATEALRFLNSRKDSLYISSAYNNIAISYRLQGFHDDAEKEFRNALRFSTTATDSLKFLHNIGLALQIKGDYSQAIKVFEELLDLPVDHTPTSRARYEDNLAYTRWLKDPSLSIESDLIAIMEKRVELNDREGLLASYTHLVDYYKDKSPAEAENMPAFSLKRHAVRKQQHRIGCAKVYGNPLSR